MIIDMPSSPNFASVRFALNRTIAASRSQFTYKQRTQEYDGVYWSAEVTLPPMKRADALEWTTFLTRLQGVKNTFLMADPSHLTNSGTYNQTWLATENRVSDTSETLSFTASSKTITAGTSIFTNAFAGDFIVVLGATNDDNNGTFKITTKTSATAVVVDRDLVDESTTAGCKVQQNIKGATGLSLTNVSSGAGTIKKGDYLAIHDAASATSNSVQYVMAVEDATASGSDYGVRIEPKLRANITAGHYVKFSSPKGQFRLASNQASWSVNEASIYGLSFTAVEVING
jgi:Rps23 Pro-64 3,4-dihydroxylase Tpa1-like proline 4-hydroxylase